MPVMEGKAFSSSTWAAWTRSRSAWTPRTRTSSSTSSSSCSAVLRRHQPRGHLPAQVLPHPRHPAREGPHPGLARRPAGHRGRHRRRRSSTPSSIVGKDIRRVKLAMIGAGAANIAIGRLLIAGGVTPKNMILCDSKGTLHKGRDDLKNDPARKMKWHFAQITNDEGRHRRTRRRRQGRRTCSSPSPSPARAPIKKEWIRAMAKDAVVFVCANPMPEIWPWEAKEAGARIVATGPVRLPEPGQQLAGLPGHLPGHAGRHGQDHHRRDVHRGRARAGRGRRGQRPARGLPHPHDGRVGGLSRAKRWRWA